MLFSSVYDDRLPYRKLYECGKPGTNFVSFSNNQTFDTDHPNNAADEQRVGNGWSNLVPACSGCSQFNSRYYHFYKSNSKQIIINRIEKLY